MVIHVKILNVLDASTPPEVIARALATAIEAITQKPCDLEIVARDDEYGIDISRVVVQ